MSEFSRSFILTQLRSWSTPLTIGAFILMAGTGVLMFFECDQGLTAVVHQWFSWFFLIGAGGHMAANINPLKKHLKTRWGKVSAIGFAIIFFLSCFSWGKITGPQLQRPIEQALVDAPLSALAGVLRTEPGRLLGELHQYGVAATLEQSIHDISTQNGIDENKLLGIVFLLER